MQTMVSRETRALLLKATLPLPPGINQSYRTVTIYVKGKPRAILVKSEAAKLFEQEAHYKLHDCFKDRANIDLARTAKIGLAVELRYYFKTLWKRDIDGGDKAALDVIFAHMGINDNRIVDFHVWKLVDKENPRLEVEIRIA